MHPKVFVEGLVPAQLTGPVLAPVRLDVGQPSGQCHADAEIHGDTLPAVYGSAVKRDTYVSNPPFTERFVSRQ